MNPSTEALAIGTLCSSFPCKVCQFEFVSTKGITVPNFVPSGDLSGFVSSVSGTWKARINTGDSHFVQVRLNY